MRAKNAWTLLALTALATIQTGRYALADEVGCLVVGAWDEARGEPAPVIEAVVSTIVNRARARGLSVCDAVMDPAALSGVTPAMHELFSEAAKPRDELTPQPHTRTDRAQLAVVEAAAEQAVAGTLPDRSRGATHFYSPLGMRELGLPTEPSWAASMVQTASVGPFIFMREKGQSPASEAAFSPPSKSQRRNSVKPVAPVAAIAPVEADLSDPQLPPFDPNAESAPPPFAPARHGATPTTPETAQLSHPVSRPSRSDPIFALAPPPYVSPRRNAITATPLAPETAKIAESVSPLSSSGRSAAPLTPPPAPSDQVAGPAVPSAPAGDGLEEWVAPPSPFDPTAPRQIVRREQAEPPMQRLDADSAVASVNPIPLASRALTPVRALSFSPPHLGQPVEMATVVLDSPHFLELPGAGSPFAIVAEASAAELPSQSQESDNGTQAPGDSPAADIADSRGSSGEQQPSVEAAAPSAAEYGPPASREAEAPPTPLFGQADGQPAPRQQTAETDGQDEIARQPVDPPAEYVPPAYERPVYSPRAYAGPQGNYWTPRPAPSPAWVAPPPGPFVGYWPYRPTAWTDCPARNRRIVMVAMQWGGIQPRLVRRAVCAM